MPQSCPSREVRELEHLYTCSQQHWLRSREHRMDADSIYSIAQDYAARKSESHSNSKSNTFFIIERSNQTKTMGKVPCW